MKGMLQRTDLPSKDSYCPHEKRMKNRDEKDDRQEGKWKGKICELINEWMKELMTD
jgi:hypothetical protein